VAVPFGGCPEEPFGIDVPTPPGFSTKVAACQTDRRGIMNTN
jgi:hypothetical protein